MKIIECVPNFSEGQNKDVIDKIAASIKEGNSGTKLLNIDPGYATNRTVYTYAGEPEAVIQSTFNAFKAAADLIDMRRHHGTHPRIGAVDVCPLVPVAEITLEECAAYARRLSRKVGEELGIPVYCYEAAASTPDRINLAKCREGEYEGIKEKLANPSWKPDYGPSAWNERVAKSGISVIGARNFLIAINFNLNTTDVAVAKAIAGDVRESGRLVRKGGNPSGEIIRIKGPLKGCKAIGWYIDEYKRAQVSMNVTDINATPVHKAYEKVCERAAAHGVKVTGCELIGLVPKRVLTEAGEYFYYDDPQRFAEHIKDTVRPSEKELIDLAVKKFNLAELKPFETEKRIIENLL